MLSRQQQQHDVFYLRSISIQFLCPANSYSEATVLDFCNKQKIFLIAFEFEGTFHLSELASWTSQLVNEMGIFHRVFAEKPSPSQCILFRISLIWPDGFD